MAGDALLAGGAGFIGARELLAGLAKSDTALLSDADTKSAAEWGLAVVSASVVAAPQQRRDPIFPRVAIDEAVIGQALSCGAGYPETALRGSGSEEGVGVQVQEQWRQQIEANARAYWTPQRLQDQLGGKDLLLRPDRAPVLLRAMGILRADGSLLPARVRKFRQINHLLRTLIPSFEELAERFGTVRILDAGCGRSALTMLTAWWFATRGHNVQILGVDRNEDVILGCREQAALAGLCSLRFVVGELDTLPLSSVWEQVFGTGCVPLHGLISLHACDRATDDALVLAVQHQASFVAVAPCCQAELSAAWKGCGGVFGPVHESPHLRRTMAATLTDTFRVLLLRSQGYHVRATEFVEAHHTPKNTLIRGMRSSEYRTDLEALAQYDTLVETTGGAGIALAHRLRSICDTLGPR